MSKEQTPITAWEFYRNSHTANVYEVMEQFAQYREKKALERFIDWCDTEEKNYKSKEELIEDFLKQK